MGGRTNDLKQDLHAIMNRLWLVVLIVVISVGSATWFVQRRPEAYKATATLLVTAPVIAPESEAGFRPDQERVTTDVVQLVNSRPIAERVARRVNTRDVGRIQRAIEATAVRNSSLIRVSARSEAPGKAADIANVTAEEFVAFFQATNRTRFREERQFIESQLASARAKLEVSERALQTFKEANQMPIVTVVTTQSLGDLAAAQSALDAASTQRREVVARLEAARARLTREQPVIVASRSTSDNPVFRRYQDRLVDLEIQRATLAQTYTPQHPRMEQVTREIAEIRSKLTAEARTAIAEEVTTNNPIHARLLGDVTSLEVEQAAAVARVEALQAIQRRRQATLTALPAAEAEFNRLQREQRVLESNFVSLSSRYQEILLRENQAGFFPASLQLVEAAVPPLRPVPSPVPKAAAAGAFGGLVLGIVAALLLESLDDSIRSAEDAERALGVPVLAQVPMNGHATPVPATAMYGLVGLVVVLLAYSIVAGTAAGAVRSAVATIGGWAAHTQGAVYERWDRSAVNTPVRQR